jgi:sulfide:quinone oxidoreductase
MADTERFHLVIAGGGVAALEALLALRKLVGDAVAITMLAPKAEFRMRPLSVTEPFGIGSPRRIDLLEFALEHDAYFRRDELAEVFPRDQSARTTSGAELPYDALLVAVGARLEEAVPGAVTFQDVADSGNLARLLAGLGERSAGRLVFALPAVPAWPLGVYDLALLARSSLRDHDLGGIEVMIVTPEHGPLELFGASASATVGELLDRAGITLRLRTTPTEFADGQLRLEGGGSIECDEVIAMPAPAGAAVAGLPTDELGFLPTDRLGRVHTLRNVFAAGDVTSYPIKQGGLAAQQADTAAASIAALSGAAVDPEPFRPVLRGALLTEWGPRFMRVERDDADEPNSIISSSILWWPPSKVAAKHLAPYLVEAADGTAGNGTLSDLDQPEGEDPAAVDPGHREAFELALLEADAHAARRDFKAALRWLEAAEDLELYLSPAYERKRLSWQELSAAG